MFLLIIVKKNITRLLFQSVGCSENSETFNFAFYFSIFYCTAYLFIFKKK